MRHAVDASCRLFDVVECGDCDRHDQRFFGDTTIQYTPPNQQSSCFSRERCIGLSFRILAVCVCALSIGRSLAAQDQSPANTALPANAAAQSTVDAPQWQPFGFVPVDQGGAGRRGYVLPGESAVVAEPGVSLWSSQFVASNNFYREETDHFLVRQRAESH